MIYLVIGLFSYLGSCVAKYFIAYVLAQNSLKEPLFKKKIQAVFFLVAPYFYLWDRKLSKKHLVVQSRNKLWISESLGITSFCLLALFLFYFYSSLSVTTEQFIEVLFHIIFIVVISLFLLSLAIFDIFTLTIPSTTLRQLTFLIILANIVVGFSNLFFEYDFVYLRLGRYENILAFLALGITMLLIRRVTHDKGLGDGDVELMASLGLALGLNNSFSFLFFTIMIGAGLSLLYALFIKKVKDVIVPFVPFVLLGFIFTVGFGGWLFKLVFNA